MLFIRSLLLVHSFVQQKTCPLASTATAEFGQKALAGDLTVGQELGFWSSALCVASVPQPLSHSHAPSTVAPIALTPEGVRNIISSAWSRGCESF